MRTNIDIDETLMKKAMKASKAKTKKETVEKALQALIEKEARQDMRKMRGKVEWEGDLEEMRSA